MKRAYIFPGQGAQFEGMAKELIDKGQEAIDYLSQSNSIMGFDIQEIMTTGKLEDLTQTKVTQPAIFIHSVISYLVSGAPLPDMVAGHSLGEFSALVANQSLSFEDGLKLVSLRAQAMQKACEEVPSTMAAVLGLSNETVEQICKDTEGIVVPANYNCPGQLVISGTIKAVEDACEKMKIAGAKRALILNVGGAFHSPLMQSAQEELARAIETTVFKDPICPIYQNVTASKVENAEEIKFNLIAQLTAPVKWTQSVQQMIADGAEEFVEFGPGKVLSGLVKKIRG